MHRSGHVRLSDANLINLLDLPSTATNTVNQNAQFQNQTVQTNPTAPMGNRDANQNQRRSNSAPPRNQQQYQQRRAEAACFSDGPSDGDDSDNGNGDDRRYNRRNNNYVRRQYDRHNFDFMQPEELNQIPNSRRRDLDRRLKSIKSIQKADAEGITTFIRACDILIPAP